MGRDPFGKLYIGDGVYVEVQQGSLLLTTDRQDERYRTVTHYIALEPEQMDELINYYERAKQHTTNLRKQAEKEEPEP